MRMMKQCGPRYTVPLGLRQAWPFHRGPWCPNTPFHLSGISPSGYLDFLYISVILSSSPFLPDSFSLQLLRVNLEGSELLSFYLPRNEALEKEKEKLREDMEQANKEHMSASTEAATIIRNLQEELDSVRRQLRTAENARAQLEAAHKAVEQAKQEAVEARTAQGVVEANLRSAEQKMKTLNKVIQYRAEEVAQANEQNRKSRLEVDGLRSANTMLTIKMEELIIFGTKKGSKDSGV